MILLVDALVGAGGGALLLEFLANGAVNLFFEDWLGLDGLKLRLEVFELPEMLVMVFTTLSTRSPPLRALPEASAASWLA